MIVQSKSPNTSSFHDSPIRIPQNLVLSWYMSFSQNPQTPLPFMTLQLESLYTIPFHGGLCWSPNSSSCYDSLIRIPTSTLHASFIDNSFWYPNSSPFHCSSIRSPNSAVAHLEAQTYLVIMGLSVCYPIADLGVLTWLLLHELKYFIAPDSFVVK